MIDIDGGSIGRTPDVIKEVGASLPCRSPANKAVCVACNVDLKMEKSKWIIGFVLRAGVLREEA